MCLVREMMFGFGDSIEPYPETVKLMDDLVKDFITNLVPICFFKLFKDSSFHGHCQEVWTRV